MMTLDRHDRAILDALQRDGRLSNVNLAKAVNLSESACLRRVRLLEQSGLIYGHAILVDQKLAGYPSTVFVQISLDKQQQKDIERFELAVADIPEVMECYLMTGDSDFLLRVIAADATDYERIHTQLLTRLPGVARVRSSFSLRTVIKKQTVPVR
jgi:Lrp/AsnC family transcriptional regulator, leucine-responsive regulatory protein